MVEELLHGLLLVEELDDKLVTSGNLLVLVVASWVVDGAAVKDKSASIATGIIGDTSLV